VARRRFQKKGCIIKRGKTLRYYGTYREDVLQSDGTFKRLRRCVLLGLVKDLSKRAAQKAFQPYLDRVNEAIKTAPKSGITLEEFVREWRANVAGNLKDSAARTAESHLRAHIIPKLGSRPLTEINTKLGQSLAAYLGPGRSRKTVENVLLTLSSILRTARAWDYACGNFSLKGIIMPREGVRKEQRNFTDAEVGKILSAAREPFATIFAVTAVLGLRVGETLALRIIDVDFTRKIIRVRQSVDAATWKIQAVKSRASSADLQMPPQLEARLRSHLASQHFRVNDVGLLFVNKRRRPYSANKLREKVLHPLLAKLGIPHGGFHSARHGAASALIADGANLAVVKSQLRHSDVRTTMAYTHTDRDQQREAVERRAARIERLAVK
jgi:integrase